MNEKKPKLKSCPFCGVSAIKIVGDIGYYFKHLKECWLYLMGMADSEVAYKDEIAAWNRREKP